jgi:prepilin-type N-terminal cleavage/methylation domain-containing protein
VKKGFTLVELLAVIAILGIILVIAIPNVKDAITTSYEKIYEYNLERLQSAAKDYFVYKGIRLADTEKNIINIKQMVDENYLKEIKDPDTKETCEGFVIVSRSNKNYVYEPYLKCGDNYISDNYYDINIYLPVITILGNNPTNINVNSTYVDAGATALDDVDGDVTSKIIATGTVNPSVVGSYTIAYTVKDSSNNTATETRTVNVIDNILPTVAFGTNGNSTYAKSRSTTVTVSDAHIGVNTSSLKYLWNTSTTAPAETSFSTIFTNGGTISSPAEVTGFYYLWILAKDNAGNTTITRTNVFYLDSTSPTIATSIAGTMLYTDPTFASGTNSANLYNNTGNGAVTMTRVAISGAPLGSGYGLEITAIGAASHGWGGFYFATQTDASKVYITRIVAKIPVGYNINWTSNVYGGGTFSWLTDTAGTGTWKEYICQVNVGTNGSYGTTNFYYITGSPAPTSTNPLIWQVAYATVFDTTKSGTSNSVLFTSSDANSGIVGYGVNQSSTTAPTFTSVTNTSSLNTAIDNITSNGTYYLWVKDAAGNTSNKAFTVSYVV